MSLIIECSGRNAKAVTGALSFRAVVGIDAGQPDGPSLWIRQPGLACR
jgi:hypothetical protein